MPALRIAHFVARYANRADDSAEFGRLHFRLDDSVSKLSGPLELRIRIERAFDVVNDRDVTSQVCVDEVVIGR